MNGKTLKERIAQLSNMTYTDIAKRLNVSEQSMYQYFLVNDVKSGLIERICEIIGVDISTMYGIEPVQGINHNAGDVITGDNVANRTNEESKQMITIIIPPYAQPIAARYIDALHRRAFRFYRMYKNENDFVRAINLGLKEIGAELGIERLQFYAARHSWATIARNDLHIGKDTINEALNHVDSTMAVTDTYIRKSFDNINEANRQVVDYITEKSQQG